MFLFDLFLLVKDALVLLFLIKRVPDETEATSAENCTVAAPPRETNSSRAALNMFRRVVQAISISIGLVFNTSAAGDLLHRA